MPAGDDREPARDEVMRSPGHDGPADLSQRAADLGHRVGEGASAVRDRVAAAMRPRLRGWSHLAAAGPWLAGTVALVVLARGHPGRQVALAGYGLASTWLFLVSGVYHSFTWAPGRRHLLRRIDHANIFVLVAATYTPVVLTVLSGAWTVTLLAVVWGLALVGGAVEVGTMRIPRRVLALLYVCMGWVAVAALPVIATHVGAGALATLLLGGLLYTLGALAYAFRRPDLVPGWFGYHELFHACVIAANALFFAFMVAAVARHP